jgi:high-affinity iron transporter
MIPALLITFREVIEATLIVATILGILTKLNQSKSIKTVWLASISAGVVCVGLLLLGSLLGLKVRELYGSGRVEPLFEGTLMVISAIFITWAVFWLHRYFAQYKVRLLQQIKTTISGSGQLGLFILVFTAVFREGFEIVLFLSTIYLSEQPIHILSGFGLGMVLGLLVAVLCFTATLKLPVFRAFQMTTVLLILFAAGLLARGVGELGEAGVLPHVQDLTLLFLPEGGRIAADTIKAVFGLSRTMNYLQLSLYAVYIAVMRWYLFLRKKKSLKTSTI